MTLNEQALKLHEEWQGKLETVSKSPVKSRQDLSLAYTPGVAEPCKVIAEDKEAAYRYTMKANTVAVVSDGSAVLGLGNIGPYAAMPVMEGKAVLFKEFGNVNAVPICLDTQDTEEIIKTVTYLAPGFGGISAGADGRGLLIHTDGLCLDIRAQHAYIRILLAQLCHKLLGSASAGVQEFRKRH